jgi:hypothetical protein
MSEVTNPEEQPPIEKMSREELESFARELMGLVSSQDVAVKKANEECAKVRSEMNRVSSAAIELQAQRNVLQETLIKLARPAQQAPQKK